MGSLSSRIPSLTGQSFASWDTNSPVRLDYACLGIVPIVLAHGVSCFSNNRQAVAWEAGDLWYLHEVRCFWVVGQGKLVIMVVARQNPYRVGHHRSG